MSLTPPDSTDNNTAVLRRIGEYIYDGSVGPPPILVWILATGFWYDAGVWVDSDVWND